MEWMGWLLGLNSLVEPFIGKGQVPSISITLVVWGTLHIDSASESAHLPMVRVCCCASRQNFTVTATV